MNTIAPEAFTEIRNGNFQAKMETNIVASDICNISRNRYLEFIRTPHRSDAVATTGTGRQAEAEVKDFTVSDDFVKLEDFIILSEKVEEADEAYTAADLTSESIDRMNIQLLKEVDKKVFADALATPGVQTAPAIVDAATAVSSTRKVAAQLAGFGGSMDDRYVVCDTDILEHFIEAGALRETALGDKALDTGTIYQLNGLRIYAVLPGQIAAGKALAGVKGKINLYLDEIGMRSKLRQATASAQNKVALADVRVLYMHVAVKVWQEDKPAVYAIG